MKRWLVIIALLLLLPGRALAAYNNILGTASQITVSPSSGNLVLSLAGPYAGASFTAHATLLGEGASAISSYGPCATGAFPYGQTSADPICSTLIMPNAATIGDLLEATSANTIGRLAAVAAGSVLTSNGLSTVPIYRTAPYLSGTSMGLNELGASGGGGVGYEYEIATVSSASGFVIDDPILAPASYLGCLTWTNSGTLQANKIATRICSISKADNTNLLTNAFEFWTTNGATAALTMRHGPNSTGSTGGTWTELVGATNNALSFSTIGVAPPGLDSIGEKIQLNGSPGTANINDYAIGVGSLNLWMTSAGSYSFYQDVNATVGTYPTFTTVQPAQAFYGVVANASGALLTSGRALGFYAFATLPSYSSRIVTTDTAEMFLRLNETSGTVAADSTANSNTGTYVGAPTLNVVGPVLYDANAGGITLSGSGQNVTVATSATMTVGDIFSAEIWFKRSATQGAAQYLLCQGSNGFYVSLTAANNIEFGKIVVNTPNAIATSTSTYTSTTAWVHLVVTKNAATSANIIVNGVDVTGTVTNQTIAPANGALWIGSTYAPAAFFPGSIAEVALYNTALTPTKAFEHFQEATAYKQSRYGWCSNCGHARPVNAGVGSLAWYDQGQWNGAPDLTGNPIVTGDLLYASAAGLWHSLADVAVGSYLRSGGVTTAPLWSTLVLPNAATTGDLMAATSTNTVGSVADVALGRILVSGGVGAVPTYLAAGTSGQGLVSQGAANPIYQAFTDHFGATVDGATAGAAGSATNLTACITAAFAGTFTALSCTRDVSGTCTTAPSFNVRNNTAGTVGTLINCTATVGSGTIAQTLAFAAGDVICIVKTVAPATCATSLFNAVATVKYP